MDDDALYPVCPHRNVHAAFERFHGPDSGGLERFFGDEGTLELSAFAAVARCCERLERRALMLEAAAQALLLLVWAAVRIYGERALSVGAVHPQLPLLPEPRPIPGWRLLSKARNALPCAATAIAQSYRARRARGWSDWVAHPQLPLLLGPQPVAALS